MAAEHASGIIGVVGRPNVGKSSLINLLVGQKVSIVSDKPQTTRRRIMGIVTRPDFQMVLVDTPGLHRSHHLLGKRLNERSDEAIQDSEALMVVVDVSRMPHKEDVTLSEHVRNSGWHERRHEVVLCMNKMDLLKAENVERHFEAYTDLFPSDSPLMTNAKKAQNIDKLMSTLVEMLHEGPRLFPEETLSDTGERFLLAELVREKALALTRQEVPHSIATVCESWSEQHGRIRASVVLMTETQGQKAILIGKGGQMLRRIGTDARLEAEELLGKPLFLETFVKVRAGWRDKPGLLDELELGQG